MHSTKRFHTVLVTLALALLYYAMARVGLMLSFESTNVSPLWPPAGVALAALLMLGWRAWPGVALGAFSANLVAFLGNQVDPGAAVGASLAIGAGNTIEALAATWLLRRARPLSDMLGRPEQAYQFVAVTALAAGLAALVGAGSLLWAGVVQPSAVAVIGTTWWIGDLAAMMLITPLLLAWHPAAPARGRAGYGGALELLAFGALLALLFGRAPDSGERIFLFVLLPCIGWAAHRHGRRGTTLAMAVAAVAAVAGSVNGTGPFGAGNANSALLGLQVFMVLFSMVGMLLAADADERSQRKDSAAMQKGAWLHWGVFFGCMLLTAIGWHYVASDTERRALERFDAEVVSAKRSVEQRIDAYAQILGGGGALVTAAPGLSRADWHAFVSAARVDTRYPGFQVLGIARRVTDAGALERRMVAGGLPGYAVWPPGPRDAYVAIVMVEPHGGRNLRALGFDMNSEPVRRLALTRAMDSGELAVSRKVTLVQEQGSNPQAGFLMYLPVYRRGAALDTLQQRRAALDLYVYGAFRMDDLMNGILGASASRVAIEVFDSAAATPAGRMFPLAPALAHAPRAAPLYRGSTALSVGDQRWTMQVSSLPAFEAGVDHAKGMIVLSAGTLIALLLFGMVRALRVSSEDALALATSMRGALRQSERRFAVVVDSASEFAIIATGLDGVITVFSVGAERMLGYTAGEMVGLATPAVFHSGDEVAARGAELSLELGRAVGGFEVFVVNARSGFVETREWTYVCKDGSRLPVQLTVNAIRDGDGVVTGFLGIARDVTEQQRIDKDLREAIARAASASRAKSEFVANMSHELRTPLNAMLGMAQLLQRTALNDGQRRDVDAIRTAGVALLGILNDILDFSKIEAGKMELASAPFRIDELAAALATMMGLNARAKPLELTIALDPGLPLLLLGDALRLQQVLVNLAGNAVKFTEHGHVAIGLRCAARHGDGLTLEATVEDSGIGMTGEQLGAVFSEFAQADSSTTRRFGGTGLGLAISRRLVTLMGGQIVAESTPGVGSSFRFQVPLAVAPQAPALPGPALAGLRVMPCEPAPASAAVLGATLAALGVEAIPAAAGGDPGEAAAADVILLDYSLAGPDPAARVAALRAGSGAALVLMLSAFDRATAHCDPAALGADGILDKPVTPIPLGELLRALRARGSAGPGMAAAVSAAPSLQGRLLLVEDNLLNQAVAQRMLEAAGAEVDIAENGQQALDMLRARPADYGLVLLDIQMPVMDGFEAVARIRGELGLALPVLAMTAGVMEHERDRCLEAGMNGFIAKPLDGVQMLAEIARHLPAVAAAHTPPAPVRAGADGVFDVGGLVAGPDDPSVLVIEPLIGALVAAGSTQLDEIAAALGEGRPVQAARILHTLRGSIGALGARRFAEATLALERAVSGGAGAAQLAPQLEVVRLELEQTLAAAAAWLALRPAAPARGALAPGPDQLAQLAAWLDQRNLAACGLYAELEAGLAPLLGAAAAARLKRAMQQLDFAGAATVLAGAGLARSAT